MSAKDPAQEDQELSPRAPVASPRADYLTDGLAQLLLTLEDELARESDQNRQRRLTEARDRVVDLQRALELLRAT